MISSLLSLLLAVSTGCPTPSAPPASDTRAKRVQHAFQNGHDVPLTLAWIDDRGRSVPLEVIPPGDFRPLQTTVGHRFVLTDPAGGCRATVVVGDVFSGTLAGTSRYRAATVRPGWHVMVDQALDPTAAPARTALAIVAGMLVQAEAALPPAALARIRPTPIFLHENAGARMQFHLSPGWLVAHGRTVELVNAVEIPDAHIFVEASRAQPGSLLHELAHGFYSQLPEEDRAATEAVYRHAMATPGYRGIEGHEGAIVDAYARTDAAEYFAELTEAYFSRNDFFPFTRSELLAYDPAGAALVARLWGVPAALDHP